MKFVLLWMLFCAIFLIGGAESNAQLSSICASCVQIPMDQVELYTELFPLTIWTDFEKYDHNSVISLHGFLKPENTIYPVTLTVTGPNGNVVAIEQFFPEPDGSFHTSFHTDSPLWSTNGFYVIKAQSGSDTRLFKTQVQLISHDLGEINSCIESELLVYAENGGVYCIPYVNGEKTTIVANSLSITEKTLSLNIRTLNPDTITISIPRYLLDSQSPDGNDSNFVVFYNDERIPFSESVNVSKEFRTLTIEYPPDREGRIDIIGTTVIPEFGILSVLVMVLGISIVVFSTKYNWLQLSRS